MKGRHIGLPLLFVVMAWGVGQAVLEVTRDDGTVLYEIDISTNPTWILRWNHSVTGVTVSDYYSWDGETVRLTDSHTPAFDAGLGHIPGRGTQLSDGRGGYWILNIVEEVPGNAYLLRVGPGTVDHRIVHNGTVYSLSDVAANERVRIGVSVK